MYKDQAKPETAKQVLQFFDWSYHSGQKLAADLDYVPMPDAVVKMVEETWKTQMKGSDGKPVFDGPAS
jgi:phosphate transport system substrate-binding protein